MHILYIGQHGVPERFSPQSSDEKRVLGLAESFGALGNSATIFSPSSILPSLKRLQGISVLHLPSFNPEKMGGLLYTFLSYWNLNSLQADVVHVHGWLAAALVRLGAFIIPEATFIWTISALPTRHHFLSRFIAWQARGVFDAIVASNREVQYHILLTYGLRATYIPDGYKPSKLVHIPASYYGLRKGQYCITFAEHISELEPLLQAYGATKTKKKLIVVTLKDNQSVHKKLSRKYPFMVAMPLISERPLTSLITQAALFIAYEKTPTSILLQAMDAQVPIIATNYPLHQEIVGTAAQFVRREDKDALRDLLETMVFYPMRQQSWGKKASVRARNHFRQERIVEEYETLYHYPLVKKVSMDSLLPAWKQIPA